MSWTTYPLGMLFRRREQRNMAHLPLLSVYRDLGIVPRRGRTDNHNKASDDLSAYKHVEVGDLVLNKMKTWQGSLGISYYEGVVSPAYFVAQPCREFDRRFLHHLLRSKPLIAKYGARSKGIRPSQWDLPWDEFKTIKVALPPLATQKRIADFLDTETARIDALITKKRRMIELLEEQHHHYALSLLTRDSNPTVLRRLLKSPPQYGASLSGSEHEPGFVRYVRITDIDESGRLQRTNPVFLSALDAQPFLLNDDDILVARSGTIGKAFHYQSSMGPAGFAGYLIRLEFDSSKILPGLVKCWTSTSHYWTQIRESAVQSTIENVSAERYKELVVPVPPLDTQPSILKDIDDHSTRTNQLTTALTTQLALLAERRQALITAAVTGELAIPEVAA